MRSLLQFYQFKKIKLLTCSFEVEPFQGFKSNCLKCFLILFPQLVKQLIIIMSVHLFKGAWVVHRYRILYCKMSLMPYLWCVCFSRELQKHYNNFFASVCQISEGYVFITPCIFFIQLPELLEMIKPKLDMISFNNIACISGKKIVYLSLYQCIHLLINIFYQAMCLQRQNVKLNEKN